MNPDATTTARRPSGSFSELFHAWRYFFWLVVLAALVVLFYTEENWRGQWAWDRHQQQLQARGAPIAASDFIPAPVPDDENFAMTPLLAPLFDFVPGTQKWRTTNGPALPQSFAARYDAASSLIKSKPGPHSTSWTGPTTDLIEWASAFLQSTNTAHSNARVIRTDFTPPQAAAEVLEALSQSEPAIEELRAATQRKYCRFNIRYQQENPATILLPHLAALKHISQILQLRASAELAGNQTDAAFADLNLMFFVVDACREEPILISHLVRFSLLQLALQPFAEGFGHWSEPQLRSFEERLERFNFCADITRSLQAERVLFGSAMIDYIQRSPDRLQVLANLGDMVGPGDDHLNGIAAAGVVLAAAPNGWLNFERLNHSRIFEDYFLPIIDPTERRISPDLARKAEEHVAAEGNHSTLTLTLRHRFFAGLLLPSVSRVLQKTAFTQTAADLAAVASALERFRLVNGAFPESLDLLAPQFIARLPRDVVNGRPLKYRRVARDQYLLYSVGWNQQDDGGTIGLNGKGEGIDLKTGDWVWKNPAAND